MTSDGISILEWFFDTFWLFFTSWKIPGTNVTPATWFIFLIFAGLVLSLIVRLFGVSWFKGG